MLPSSSIPHDEWELEAEPSFEPEFEHNQPASETTPDVAPSITPIIPPPTEEPPTLERIIEAMLFVGGEPLQAEDAQAAIRGLTTSRFLEAIEELNQQYRWQNRPYMIQPRKMGFSLELLPAYRVMREKLHGGPREARLAQPALDVLSLIAYRQPVGKAEIDAIRGADSGSILRQLVRLSLISVKLRADAEHREVRYGTTPRFLQVFGIYHLDDLPVLGQTEAA